MESERHFCNMEKSEGIKEGKQEKILRVLYGTCAGRFLLNILVSPAFSKLGGRLLDTKLSALAIGPFVRSNNIDMTQCVKKEFSSYNDFFTRELKRGARPLCGQKDAFISPCDARLAVFRINEEARFNVKNTRYSLKRLLRDEKLANRYRDGYLWLYRLSVDDYHRYIYPVSGQMSACRHINGVFHTVNPVAGEHYPIYKENTREYCLIKTPHDGTLLMMEVGAMLVGKIENRITAGGTAAIGEEKGNFAFGGSTIIVLTQKGRAEPEERFLKAAEESREIKVVQGEKTGSFLHGEHK